MTIKKVVLGASLLIAGHVVAQDKTYTVREGDTLSEIASKFGVKTKAVLAANNLASADKLKLGQTIRIPAASMAIQTSAVSKASQPGNVYTVKEGDNDIVIAKKLGVRAKELRLANMGTKWTNLRPGQTLNIPGSGKSWYASLAHRPTPAVKNSVQANPVAKKSEAPAKKTTVVAKTYKVQEGDNDWIIAKKVGTKPSVLRNLNPDVKWSSLQIGTQVRIPGAAKTVVAKNGPNLPRLRSRYAAIGGEGVTLRRGPGTGHDIVTRVDRGTRGTVLDREGSWYKLRFPRGTEAWVRGDYLIAVSAPQIVASEKRKTTKSSSKRTVVASNTPLRSSSRSSRTRRESSYRPSYAKSGGNVVNLDTRGNALLEKAKGYLGVRYRYGAASRSATDCSGFTTQVYRSQGVKLPRTAREQSGRGQSVGKGSLKEGDLVFFKTNRGTRINHVGIYVGNGKFMHASSGRGRVMVSSLNEGYYQRRYAGAKRVANFKNTSKKKEAEKPVAKKVEEPKVEPVVTPTDPKPTVTSGEGGQ